MNITRRRIQSVGLKSVFAAAVLSLAGWGVAQAQTVDIQHAQGKTTVPVKPATTAVFDLAALDIMTALGVEAAGVPEVGYPSHLAAYAEKNRPRIGTLFEPNYEAVNALKPDLIIVGGRSAAKYPDLARMAPTIDLTVEPGKLVESVKKNTRTLASIYGKEDKAEELLAQLDQSLQELQAAAARAGNGLIILTVGGKMSAYGPGSRFGVIHDAFGVPPAVETRGKGNHGQAVSFEFVYKADPDWLFVIDRDAAIGREGHSARQLLDNELMHKTSAWKNDRIVYLDAMNWYLLGSAGLTALQENMAQISRALDAKR